MGLMDLLFGPTCSCGLGAPSDAYYRIAYGKKSVIVPADDLDQASGIFWNLPYNGRSITKHLTRQDAKAKRKALPMDHYELRGSGVNWGSGMLQGNLRLRFYDAAAKVFGKKVVDQQFNRK